MIFDVHTHAFPDFLATKAMDALCAPLADAHLQQGDSLSTIRADITPCRDGTLGSLIRSMDAVGVDRAFLANIATRPEHSTAILNWSRQIASDRIVPLGSVHPRSPTWEAELHAVFEAGLPGIKLHPQYQHLVVDADEMLPIYRKAAALGLFVLFHAGFDIAFPGDESAAPRRLARVRTKVEDLVMIAAHMGGWQAWSEVETHLVGRDIYLDTSYLHQVERSQLERFLLRHPHDRILFGSDSPWLPQGQCIKFIRALPIGKDSVARILGENAYSLHPSLRNCLEQSRALATSERV